METRRGASESRSRDETTREILNRQADGSLSATPERTAEVISWKARGEGACSRVPLTGIVYRGPFCSPTGTIRDAHVGLSVSAPSISLPRSGFFASEMSTVLYRRCIAFCARRWVSRTIETPREKEAGRRALELNYFHFRGFLSLGLRAHSSGPALRAERFISA